MSAATLIHSNLGGFGPDLASPPTLLYRNVGRDAQGSSINLVVAASNNSYVPDTPASNGLQGRYGSINVASGTSNFFTFTFVDSEHGEPVGIDSFYLSVYDIDLHPDGTGRGKRSQSA